MRSSLFQGHVVACLRRVNDIIDLKTCTDGVKKALEDEEYEQVTSIEIDRSNDPHSSPLRLLHIFIVI